MKTSSDTSVSARPKKDQEGKPLYPSIAPFASGRLAVGDGHSLYWEQSGNPQGIPVLFLHGGPGGGIAPAYRRFFDPDRFRAVLFDQRGSGQSRPLASVDHNTTADLIADIECLREMLRIEKWIVFGGSWGSTLALAYGQAYPERCLGFVLRGVFLFRPHEVAWFLHGMGTVFPEAARMFLEPLTPDERLDPLTAYWARLTDPEPAVHEAAARRWYAYESWCSRLIPPAGELGSGGASGPVLAMARIEAHYMRHLGFLRPNQLLEELPKITHLPCAVVQGRYDMVCPIATADELVRAWGADVDYTIVQAGHSAMETPVAEALVAATERLADRL